MAFAGPGLGDGRRRVLLPHVPTATTTQPRLIEHVWSLWRNGHRKDCGLYYHGETYGWEVQLRDDGFMEFRQQSSRTRAGQKRRDVCAGTLRAMAAGAGDAHRPYFLGTRLRLRDANGRLAHQQQGVVT